MLSWWREEMAGCRLEPQLLKASGLSTARLALTQRVWISATFLTSLEFQEKSIFNFLRHVQHGR